MYLKAFEIFEQINDHAKCEVRSVKSFLNTKMNVAYRNWQTNNGDLRQCDEGSFSLEMVYCVVEWWPDECS